jgi:endonuclease YncB( thermonuclease family)
VNHKKYCFFSIKGAHYGRFFICQVIFLALLSSFPGNQAYSTPQSSCNLDSADETVAVTHVIDGDTVILKDGRHIRLIGINTPEIGRNGKASEPGADAAQKHLHALLQGHRQIFLKFDAQEFDRYKRTLAHLFLPDGKNIQANMLEQGLATPLTIPPNLIYLDCYLHHSNQAIASLRGLWSLPQYKLLASKTLDRNIRGYHVIKGRVERIGESQSSIWINLAGKFALRIKRKDLSYFNEPELLDLKGKVIQVRGWVYIQNKEFRINLKHRSDMMLIPKLPGNIGFSKTRSNYIQGIEQQD